MNAAALAVGGTAVAVGAGRPQKQIKTDKLKEAANEIFKDNNQPKPRPPPPERKPKPPKPLTPVPSESSSSSSEVIRPTEDQSMSHNITEGSYS